MRRVLGLIRDEAVEDRNELMSGTPSDIHSTTLEPATGGIQLSASAFAKDEHLSVAGKIQRAGTFPAHGSVSSAKSLFHLLSVSGGQDGERSPFGNSGTSTPSGRPLTNQIHALRSEIIDGIEEIQDEIKQADDQIAAAAEVQIHPGDYVLLYHPSDTVRRFVLRAAKEKRKFTVLYAIEAPTKQASRPQHTKFRDDLAKAGIQVINILAGGLMAYMSRVNRVIIGARAVVANGGVVTESGAAAIARAAKEYGNPVVVLSGVYKLCPVNPYDEAAEVEWGSSASYIDFADGEMVNSVDVQTAVSELLPAEYIDTYITNL